MKIAGRKNDGAWYRTNKWLQIQTDEFKTRLKADTDLLAAATIVYGVMGNLAGTNTLGTSGISDIPASPLLMLAGWIAEGFPRTVYSGQLAWDRYIKVGPGDAYPPPSANTNNTGKTLYIPQNAANMRRAGIAIRSKLNRHRLVSRGLTDIVNSVSDVRRNPGGVANAQKNTLDGQ